MQEIKQFFINIGKGNIDENATNLVSGGLIDSLDIMRLVNCMDDFYHKELDIKFITPENFESFESIEKMLQKAFDL